MYPFLIGDFVDLETAYLIKKLADNLNIKSIECRQEGCRVPFNHRSQYLFNSKIKGIDDADCILIVGSNIREEAAIINSRIRKRVLSKDIPIALVGEQVDLTYDYRHLGNDINILTDLLNEKNNFSEELSEANKPMIIIGQSLLNRDDSIQIYSLLETLADKFDFIQDDWNGFNVLQLTAARVGALEVGCFQKNNSLEDIYNDARNGKYKFIFSIGADEIDYSEFKNCQVAYIGTHGDRGASAASIVMPSATNTEKDAIFINTEGRLQYANKANFPPGEAKEDWKIINQISELLELEWPFIDLSDVRNAIFEDFPLLFEDFSYQFNHFAKLLENKFSDETEITSKDPRTIKEKK